MDETVATLRTLAQLEESIGRSLGNVAEDLMEILDRKLYKDSHASFNLYCEERWGITGRTARRQIEQARALKALPPGDPAPSQRAVAATKRREPTPDAAESVTRASHNLEKRVLATTESVRVRADLVERPDLPATIKPAPRPAVITATPAASPVPGHSVADLDRLLVSLVGFPDRLFANVDGTALAAACRKLNAEADRRSRDRGEHGQLARVAAPPPSLARREVTPIPKKAAGKK